MKNFTLILLVFLLMSCATYSEFPESTRHYDNIGYDYFYPNKYFEPYPFWQGRYLDYYYWDYKPYPRHHVYIDNKKVEKPKHIRDHDKDKSYYGDKDTYTPTYRKPSNNRTPSFNGTPSKGTRQQPSEGSKPINGRNIK